MASSVVSPATPVPGAVAATTVPAARPFPWPDAAAVPHNLGADASPRFRAVAETVLAAMAEAGVPGAALGILAADREEHAAFGIESILTNRPVTAGTRFQLASLTKPFTATAIMRLIAQRRLDLDATVRTYLPDLRLADEDVAARVTLRHLLTHTGGWWGGYDVDTGSGDDAIARFLAEKLPDLPQIAPLGALFGYNNTGFTILGRLVEVAAGQDYRSALAGLVLDPLALSATDFAPERLLAGPHADGHASAGTDLRRQQPLFLPRNSDPDGGLWSTTRDQLRFARFHLGSGAGPDGGRLLHPYALELMRTLHVAVPGLPLWMGMSWFVLDQLGLRFVTHSGDSSGQHAELWMIPERAFALVLLTNASPAGAAIGGPVLLEALRQYLGVAPTTGAPTTAPTPLDPGAMAEYAGRYAVPNGAYVVRQEGSALVLSVEARPLPDEISPLVTEPVPTGLRMEQVGADQFANPDEGLQIAYVRKPDGRIGWIATGGRLMPRTGSA